MTLKNFPCGIKYWFIFSVYLESPIIDNIVFFIPKATELEIKAKCKTKVELNIKKLKDKVSYKCRHNHPNSSLHLMFSEFKGVSTFQ